MKTSKPIIQPRVLLNSGFALPNVCLTFPLSSKRIPQLQQTELKVLVLPTPQPPNLLLQTQSSMQTLTLFFQLFLPKILNAVLDFSPTLIIQSISNPVPVSFKVFQICHFSLSPLSVSKPPILPLRLLQEPPNWYLLHSCPSTAYSSQSNRTNLFMTSYIMSLFCSKSSKSFPSQITSQVPSI